MQDVQISKVALRAYLEGMPIYLTSNLWQVPAPGWTCQDKCRPLQLDQNGNVIGQAYRGQDCFWLGQTCQNQDTSLKRYSPNLSRSLNLKIARPYKKNIWGEIHHG